MLKPGQMLSHYRLEEMIGKGGMGEVWRATDSRLDREVAVKVLPEILTRDSSRLDRFAREAKLLASLNHPGIATIHDVDEHEGVRFLVMELVRGDDLAERLQRGAMPLTEALDAAVQIARAVEAAHGQGVVHRDLKPANVKRGDDGQIKVLDFGLAKAMEPDPSSVSSNTAMSPTMTSAGTVAGVILGTAAYMSPEQARGRKIDKRTDVWSFGVMLYEMLTGDNPFHGDTVADSVGAIMHRNPDLDALPPQTPTAVRRLLRRCLTRERADRLHDIADVRIELEEAIANPVVESQAGGPDAAAPPSKLPWVALAVLVPVAAGLAWWLGSRATPSVPDPMRQFELQAGVEVDTVEVSPDGTRVAYVIGDQLLIRSLDTLNSRMIAEGEAFGITPVVWSPDSKSIAYSTTDGELKRIDLAGGGAMTLTNRPAMSFLRWVDDGYIYFIEFQAGINRVPETGGAAENFLPPHDGMLDYHGLAMLPGGKGAVTIPHFDDGNNTKIVLDRPGEETVVLHESDSTVNNVLYSPTGHIFFERDEDPAGLWALPFSTSSLSVTGPPFLVVPELSSASFSQTGDLVYTRNALSGSEREQEIVWVDRAGEVIDRLGLEVYQGLRPVPSPDGSRLAVIATGVGRSAMRDQDLWVVELDRRTATKVTEGGIRNLAPVWSADGKRIAYLRNAKVGKGEIAVVAADGTGTPEVLTPTEVQFFFTLSQDWKHLAFMTGAVTDPTQFDIAVETLGDPSSVAKVVQGPALDAGPQIHPNGEWMAYMAGSIPNFDVYLRRFPSGEGQWKVSIDGGGLPTWSDDGTRLYYQTNDAGNDAGHLMEVTFDASGGVPTLGKPVELFEVASGPPRVTPTTEGRFLHLVDKELEDAAAKAKAKGIVLIQNWLSRFDGS